MASRVLRQRFLSSRLVEPQFSCVLSREIRPRSFAASSTQLHSATKSTKGTDGTKDSFECRASVYPFWFVPYVPFVLFCGYECLCEWGAEGIWRHIVSGVDYAARSPCGADRD